MTTVLAILITLGVLIVVHEYGHYRAALACGVKVLRFSIGFGPVLWRRQRGETEFAVSAFPLGGYVKMLDGREGDVPEHERHRAFNLKPVRQRALIVLAGPMANLVLAVVLYAVVNWAGVQEVKPVIAQPAAGSLAERAGLRSGDWLQQASVDGQQWVELRSMSDLRWQVMQAVIDRQPLSLTVRAAQGGAERRLTLPLDRAGLELDVTVLERAGITGPYRKPVVGQVPADGPAGRAGLRQGDLLLSMNGRAVADGGGAIEAIRASAPDGKPQPLAIEVQRGAQRLALTVLPELVEEKGRKVPKIQALIGDMPEEVTVRYGFAEGAQRGLQQAWDMSVVTLQLMGKMLIGEASLKNLSGPITMGEFAGRSAELGLVFFIGYLAFVSLSLGVLNLLPIPVLDGGHLMYYLFEGLTGRPVPDVWMERLQRGGLAILLLMMSLALYNDVARHLGLH